MAVSVVPYVGGGTLKDPWKPLGWVPGAKSLRIVPGGADGNRSNQFAILHTPSDIADARATKVCDTVADTDSAAMRNVLGGRLNMTFDTILKGYEERGGRHQEKTAVANVIDLLATAMLLPPNGAWYPLRPSHRGQYEVVMGGELKWYFPTVRGGAGSDDFNRANETPLSGGGNWGSGYADWGDMNLTSNAARAASSATDCAARWLAETFSGGGQYSQADFGALTGSEEYLTVACRMHPSSTTDESCYMLTNINSGTDTHKLYEVSSAFGFTELDSVAGNTAAATFRLELSGSTLSPLRGGAAITGLGTTDATLDETTYTRVGICNYFESVSGTIDNWSGGALSAPPAATSPAWTGSPGNGWW